MGMEEPPRGGRHGGYGGKHIRQENRPHLNLHCLQWKAYELMLAYSIDGKSQTAIFVVQNYLFTI